jgi:superoxide dismutase
MLLHELYFASMAFGEGRPTETMAQALARDFGSVDRWRSEFVAMAKGLAGGSGWVLLVYVPRDRRLINHYAGDHGQTTAGGIPILALDMYEHAYHIDFGPTRRPTSMRSSGTSIGRRCRCVSRTRREWSHHGRSCRRSSAICRRWESRK